MNKTPNQFYKTCPSKGEAHQFDLKELGATQWRGFGIAFSYGNGDIRGGESHSSPTTQKDYDEAFFQKLAKTDPPYVVEDLLNYNYGNFVDTNRGQDLLFLKHIEFVIAPMLEGIHSRTYKAVVLQWLKKENNMILQKHLQEKNEFLKKMYENVVDYNPSGPLSVTTKPFEFGEHAGFDWDTTKRVVNELVSDGYLTSTLGMGQIMITAEGVNYLRQIEGLNQTAAPIHINAGNYSNIQVQQNTVHSTQQIDIGSDPEKLTQLIAEIRSGMDELKKYLSEDDANHLELETNYLESNLKKKSPDHSLLKSVVKNIGDILKSVPANVIANVLTTFIPLK